MRTRQNRQIGVLGIALCAVLTAAPTPSARIVQVRVGNHPTFTRVVFELDGRAGYRIERTLQPVEQQRPGRWSRGDVARVRLTLTAQSDMSWVVVDDPVPAGASVLGSGLGGQSQLLQRDERREGAVWPAFEERRFDAFRAFYRFVPKGSWTVEYTVRLNNAGRFDLPATRVEALYSPEMFGELPNASVRVKQ